MAQRQGFDAFYAASYRRIVGQVFALLGDLHEAEDVTQDAFAKASFHWSRIAAYDQPEAWVRRVAFNGARPHRGPALAQPRRPPPRHPDRQGRDLPRRAPAGRGQGPGHRRRPVPQGPDRGCVLVQAEFQPGTGRLAAFERCVANGRVRFRLVYLDPDSSRLLDRGFSFEDRWGADLHVTTMDFDQSGRHLLYMVSSADPFDYREAGRPVGTWRWSGGRPVRIDDDRTVGSGQTSQHLTTIDPTW